MGMESLVGVTRRLRIEEMISEASMDLLVWVDWDLCARDGWLYDNCTNTRP